MSGARWRWHPRPIACGYVRRDLRRYPRDAADPTSHDPMVRTYESDTRPPDCATAFALGARRLLLAKDGGLRPPWWEAVRGAPRGRSGRTGVERSRVSRPSAEPGHRDSRLIGARSAGSVRPEFWSMRR